MSREKSPEELGIDTGSHSHLNNEEFGALLRKNTIDPKKIVETWENKAVELLQDRTVHAVRYLSKEELEGLGWRASTLVMQLNDPEGKKEPVLLFSSRDDEGNDAGALFTDDDDLPTIPVIQDFQM